MNLRIMEKVSKLIFLLPILWIIGIKFFIFHLLSMIIILKLSFESKKKNIKIKMLTEHKLLFIFIVIYFFSIAVNIKNGDISRVVASIYNWTYWVIGLFMMIGIYNDNSFCIEDISNFAKEIKKLGLFIIVLFILSCFLWLSGKSYLSIDTPVRMILPSSLRNTLLGDATSMYIFTTDWMFNNNILRFVGIFNYPAETAISMAFIILFTKYSIIIGGRKDIKSNVLLILFTIVFVMALSRITWVGFIVAIFMVFVVLQKSENRKKSIMKILKISLFIVIILLLVFSKIGIIENIYSSREGSNEARMEVYNEAIELGKKNLIIGTGIKHTSEKFIVPIGSHSTYIGSFMKTGIIGFGVLICFFIRLFTRLIKISKYNNEDYKKLFEICSVFFIMSLIWMVTEDLDAPNIASFFFFINCSIITKLNKLEVNEETKYEKSF